MISAAIGIILGMLLWTLSKACRAVAHADELPPITILDEQEEYDGPIRVVVPPPPPMVPLPVCCNGRWLTVPWQPE